MHADMAKSTAKGTQSIEELFKKTEEAPAPAPAAGYVAGAALTTSKKPAKAAKTAFEMTGEEKLKEKMGEIELREKERQTQERAGKVGLPYIDLKGFPVAPEVLALLPRAEAEAARTVAFLQLGDEMRIATSNPGKEATAIAARLAEEQHANEHGRGPEALRRPARGEGSHLRRPHRRGRAPEIRAGDRRLSPAPGEDQQCLDDRRHHAHHRRGAQERRLGRAHRGRGGGCEGTPAHRRPPAGLGQAPARGVEADDQPHQAARRRQDQRGRRAAGRAHHHLPREREDRHPRLVPPDRVRRVGRHAYPAPQEHRARVRQPRHPRQGARAAEARDRTAERHDRHHRSDRIGQDDLALRYPEEAEHGGREDHHARGSDRIQARRHQPEPDRPREELRLRARPPIHPAPGPGHRDGRRDPRPRDRRDRHPGGVDGAPRALDHPHQQRGRRGPPLPLHGREGVPARARHQRHHRPAPRAPSLRDVQGEDDVAARGAEGGQERARRHPAEFRLRRGSREDPVLRPAGREEHVPRLPRTRL